MGRLKLSLAPLLAVLLLSSCGDDDSSQPHDAAVPTEAGPSPSGTMQIDAGADAARPTPTPTPVEAGAVDSGPKMALRSPLERPWSVLPRPPTGRLPDELKPPR